MTDDECQFMAIQSDDVGFPVVNVLDILQPTVGYGYSIKLLKTERICVIQGDQKLHLMITVQKTRKNILNSFNQLQ
jgi:hypothetical protein